MKKLSSVTISGGLTVDQATTLSGVVSVGGIGTGAYTSVLVRNSSNQMLYRTFSDFLNDISGSLNLSGYVPTSRTLTINGTTYDLSANRTWTITTPYVSKLQHAVKAGVAINKGQAVYVTGADGTNMIVGLASNASEATSSKTMGLLDATVSTNGFANVVTEGLLAGLDTSTANAEGDPVWLGTGGNLIYGLGSKPYAPAHLVFIGIVTRKNANNGEIFVKVQNGFELKEIHDVDLITSAPTAGQLLRYESDGLWKNWSPNYLTAEADTLQSVTNRGSSTSTDISIGGAGGDRGLRINHGSGALDYGRIRFYQDSSNISTIHSFSTAWQSGDVLVSGGAINITGNTGVTFGSWNVPDVIFRLGGSSYFRNNVGIGTSSPNATLQVANTTSGNAFSMIGSNSKEFVSISYLGYIRTRASDTNGANMHFADNGNTKRMEMGVNSTSMDWYSDALASHFLTFQHSTGRVGIGTTAPGFKIEVNGGATGNNIARFTTGGTGGGTRGLTVYSDNSQVKLQVTDNAGSQGTWAFLNLNPDGGYVGIGTTSPDTPLVVQGGSAGTGGWNRTATLSATYPGLIFNSNGTKWGGMAYDYSAAMRFWVNASNNDIFAGTLAMSILNNGNVGIGTSDPGAKLHVVGNAWINRPSNKVDNASCTELPSRVEFNNAFAAGSSGYTVFTYPTASVFRIYGDYDGNIGGLQPDLQLGLGYLTVKNSGGTIGNVGIGTTTPQVKLDVNGHVGIVGSSFIYFGHNTTNIGAWTTRTYASGSTHYFNAQTFIFNNDGYGSYQHMALTANGVNLRGKNTIDSTDSWLRLNQSGDYGSGVYTPGVMRADGGFYVSGSQVWHAGNLTNLNQLSNGPGYITGYTETDPIYVSERNSLQLNKTVHPTLLFSTLADYNKPSGYSTMIQPGSYQTPLPSHGYYHIIARRDGGGGYGALLQSYNSHDLYHGNTTESTTNISWYKIWNSGDFTSTNVSNWNTAYSWGNHASASYATTSYVTTQINNLIAGAPGALDTLDELAAALGDDSNFATTVTNSIAGKVSKTGDTMTGVLNLNGGLYVSPAIDFGRSAYSTQYANIILLPTDNSPSGYSTIEFKSGYNYPSDGASITYMASTAGSGEDSEFLIRLNNDADDHIKLQAGYIVCDANTLNGGSYTTPFYWKVVGDTKMTLGPTGNLTIAGSLTESSSLKLKENVETSEGNLEKVVNLRPVTYNKIGSQTTELGLIAEEVAEVYPEFVQYDENGEPIGVNYSRLTAALIGAVKELTKRIETLENNG